MTQNTSISSDSANPTTLFQSGAGVSPASAFYASNGDASRTLAVQIIGMHGTTAEAVRLAPGEKLVFQFGVQAITKVVAWFEATVAGAVNGGVIQFK